MPVLSDIEIADVPLVSSADIVAYSAATQEIELTAEAYDRIVALGVPVSFVVCVDRRPIYGGAFWTPISSASFDGVVIMQPLSPGTAPDRYVILEALEQAGKLR